jgi:hypothetical protein
MIPLSILTLKKNTTQIAQAKPHFISLAQKKCYVEKNIQIFIAKISKFGNGI